MASSNVIFKPSDVMELQETHKKLAMAAKQKVLQDWGVDALLESVMNPFAERRSGVSEPHAGIKADFKEGKQTSLVWSCRQAYFKRHSTEEGRDCRSELFGGSTDTVEEWAFNMGEHSAVCLPNTRQPASIYAILKYTDFLPLLASKFGTHFTCHWTMEEVPCAADRTKNPYWTPQIHKIYLRFWPKGVPADMAAKKAAAVATLEHRQETLITDYCEICSEGLTMESRFSGQVVSQGHRFALAKVYFCSEHKDQSVDMVCHACGSIDLEGTGNNRIRICNDCDARVTV